MKITVRAKTGSKKNHVSEIQTGYYRVDVTTQPIHGKANAAIIKALAKHLHIAPSHLSIVRGATAKTKVIDIT